MSETFSARLTAVATLALAVFALVTAILAFMAWQKQSGEVRDQAELLRVQAGQLEVLHAQYAQDQADRRNAQASQIVLWSEVGIDPAVSQAQRATLSVTHEVVRVHVGSSASSGRVTVSLWRPAA